MQLRIYIVDCKFEGACVTWFGWYVMKYSQEVDTG